MHKRGLCRRAVSVHRSVRPSVCPSVLLSFTFVYCVETSYHTITLFSPPGSHTILVFRTKPYGNIPTGCPNGASNAGGMKKSRFRVRPIYRFMSEMIQDRAMVIMNANSYAIYRMPFPMILNDDNPDFKVTPLFDTEYLRNGASYNRIVIGTYTCHTLRFHFEWPSVTLTDLAKYSMTRSIAAQP